MAKRTKRGRRDSMIQIAEVKDLQHMLDRINEINERTKIHTKQIMELKIQQKEQKDE